MSKTTKRKHVTKEVVDDYYVPEEDECVVKVVSGRGNNLHEVECPDKSRFLVSMPTKFRRNVWIKRGDYVIIKLIKEGKKVQGEIVYVLYSKQIKFLKEDGSWPSEFEEKVKISNSDAINKGPIKKDVVPKYGVSDDEESDDELFVNPNHQPAIYLDDDTSSSEESNDDGDDNEHCKTHCKEGDDGSDEDRKISFTKFDQNEGWEDQRDVIGKIEADSHLSSKDNTYEAVDANKLSNNILEEGEAGIGPHNTVFTQNLVARDHDILTSGSNKELNLTSDEDEDKSKENRDQKMIESSPEKEVEYNKYKSINDSQCDAFQRKLSAIIISV